MHFIEETAKLLTPREREVLVLIGKGGTTKEVATTMGLSTETIGDYRKQLCRKLDIHSTAQLVAYGAATLVSTAAP